jgi:crotonobetainyl-CoA:carnitine CoA-transferase CaiB-like acyl-CoA transferase
LLKVYRCRGKEKWIALAAGDDGEWRALDGGIGALTADLDELAVMRSLVEAGVPAGAVLSSGEYLVDPHLLVRGYFAGPSHRVTGPQRYDGSPLVFDGVLARRA